MESPAQVGNVLNEYFYSVFSADSCYDDFKSDNQEKIVIDKSGISNLIDRLKVGKPPGPDCLKKKTWILKTGLELSVVSL